MNTLYKISRFCFLFLSLICSFLIAQGYRSINYKHILQNSITKEDRHFLKKYDYTVYFYEDMSLLHSNIAKNKKGRPYFYRGVKLIVYAHLFYGVYANQNLLKSYPQTYILVSRIRLLFIKKNIASFEISYKEASNKDLLPESTGGVGHYGYESHLVRTDTVTFEWFDKKKKWFAKNVK